MKTTKIQNLKNYLFNACVERASDYEMQAPTTFEDAKTMIKSIFESEKGFDIARVGRGQAFYGWIMGLCFCSPIMEDLTPFTRCKDNIKQEIDITDKIYQIIFYGL